MGETLLLSGRSRLFQQAGRDREQAAVHWHSTMTPSRWSSIPHTRLWKILSLGFGAAIPLAVWTFVFVTLGMSISATPGGMILASSYGIVIVEIVTLALWHFGRHSSGALERAASAIFFLGASFAALWSVFAAFALCSLHKDLDSMGMGLILMAISPFPCTVVYFVNGCAAGGLAQEREKHPGWRASRVT